MELNKLAEMMKGLQGKFDSSDLGSYGILPTERADEFIDITLDQSVLLKAVTTQRVNNRTGEFVYFDLPGHVIAAGLQEGQADTGTDTGSVSIDQAFQYSCTKVRTKFALTWEMVNWNLEGPELEDRIVRRWTERLSEDCEALGIVGVGTGQGFPALEKGWFKIIEDANVQGHVINWVDNSSNPLPVDHTLFQKAYKAFISDAYARMLARNPVWIANPIVYTEYMHYLSDRGDALGAAALMGAAALRPDGVPFFNDNKGVPLIPVETVGGKAVTKLLLGDPKQLWFIVHREFALERMRNVAADTWEWYGRAYVDYAVPFPRTFILVRNILVA